MKGASAIILAGGRGERMGILSRDRTKPGLPFGGVYHVIDFVLTNCMHSGIGDWSTGIIAVSTLLNLKTVNIWALLTQFIRILIICDIRVLTTYLYWLLIKSTKWTTVKYWLFIKK